MFKKLFAKSNLEYINHKSFVILNHSFLKFLTKQASISMNMSAHDYIGFISYTLFKNENECQKTKPVPISLPKASRNSPNVKTRNKKKNL